jgi:hypothetical protein
MSAMPNSSGERSNAPKLSTSERRDLCRDLATRDLTRAAIARKYGIGRSSVTEFAARHASEIAAIAASLDDEFAGLWIADKAKRVAAYQDDHDGSLDSEFGGHYEHIKARNQIRQQVAEELGQLPPRTQVAIASVTYVVEGVDLDALK